MGPGSGDVGLGPNEILRTMGWSGVITLHPRRGVETRTRGVEAGGRDTGRVC